MNRGIVVERFSRNVCVLTYCVQEGMLDKYCDFPFIENSPFIIEDILFDLAEVMNRRYLIVGTKGWSFSSQDLLCFLKTIHGDALMLKELIHGGMLSLPFLENNSCYLDDIILDIEEGKEQLKKVKRNNREELEKDIEFISEVLKRDLINYNCLKIAM